MPGGWTPRLKSCWSLTRPLPKAPCRQSSTQTPRQILKGDALDPIIEDKHQTFRARKDGAAKELPLSPLLDPVILEKRWRWEKPKERPKPAEFTPFQKRLFENPFAHALASPVRQCRNTSIALPVAFLISLHARPHPTTNDPWLLPVALTTEKKHLGPPFRFVGRQVIATQLGRKKAWEKGVYARMAEKLGNSNIDRMVWRQDMADLILEKMRERVVSKLNWSFRFRGRLVPVPDPRSQDINDVEDVSCVLMFESIHTRADDIQHRADDIKAELEKWSTYFAQNFSAKIDPHAAPEVTHRAPNWYLEPLVPRLPPRLQFPELAFNTTLWRGKKVPVYSLTDLLGEEKAQSLLEESKYEEESCLVVKRARHNVPVEILLMQMQAYIAKPGPL